MDPDYEPVDNDIVQARVKTEGIIEHEFEISSKKGEMKKKLILVSDSASSSTVNFINILRTHFSYESASRSIFYLHVTREKLPKRILYEKVVLKMLMKLTPAFRSLWFF